MLDKKIVWGYLAALATLMIWCGFSLVSRMGGKSPLTPYDVFALRLMTASLVLLPFSRSLPWQSWKDRRMWLLACLCSIWYCPLAYHGFQYAPAAHGAILLAGMQPFLISAIIWVFMGERPSRPRFIGLFLIASGIVCAAIPYFIDWSPASVFGDMLIFISSIMWAFYTVFARKWGYSAWDLTRFIALSSAVFFLPIYFLFLPKQIAATPVSMIILQCVFQGIFATIIAMLTYLKAINALGPQRAAVFLAQVPIVTGLLAVPLLNESLTTWLLCGLVFVSSGSYIASRYGIQTVK